MTVAEGKMAELFTKGKMLSVFKNISINKSLVITVSSVLSAAYIVSIVVSSLAASIIMKNMLSIKSDNKASISSLGRSTKPNYVIIKREIMGRNLFNSNGEFPDETTTEAKGDTLEARIFDPHAKCLKSRLNVSLLGTIFMDSDNSIATVRESGYSESDVYKVGDSIIGHDDAVIVAIQPKKIVLNNAGSKECIEIEEKNIVRDVPSFEDPNFAEHDDSIPPPMGDEITEGSEDSNCILLEGSYVEKELGDGYSKIMNSARLVPNMDDNKVLGFKIFAIKNSSLLGKIKLKNGDVITQVNDISLKQPEQGFALFEAFQDEREINIHVLRGGKIPKTICVKIK